MNEIIHIYPENDTREHTLKGFSCECEFKVEFVEESILVVHKSWDGREYKERLIRKIKEEFKNN